MSYRPTDASERALVALIVAELTGHTGSNAPPAGEVREYMPYGRSADMGTAQAGEEHWTRDFIFENEWQSFRTKKDRELKLKTPFHECNPGWYKIAAKVADIFGNDTTKIIEVGRMRRDTTLKVLREHEQELEERYGITRIGIFGSVARDEATDESDVGVVVEIAPDLFGRVSLREELEAILGAKVDLVRYWRRTNHYLKRRIDTEAHYV